MKEEFINLTEEISRIDDRMTEIKREAESLDRESDEYQELNQEFVDLKTRQNGLRQFIEEECPSGDDPVFKIKELSYTEVQRAQDETASKSFSVNQSSAQIEGAPREGYYRQEVLRLGIVDSPVNGIDKFNLELGEFLFQRIDQLTTGGNVEDLDDIL